MLRRTVTLALVAIVRCQLPGMPGGPPSEARPIHKSVKDLECVVCKKAAQVLWDAALELRETAPYKKPSEDMYFDTIVELCVPEKDGGEWITFQDVVQKSEGAPLKLEDQGYLGECRRECRTVAKACANVFEEHREDVAESLFKRDAATFEKFSNRICVKWSGVCPYKAAKAPKPYVHPDEYWMPVDEEMYKMRKMQDVINGQATKYGKQPVQFVDPMQGAFYGNDDDFDDEEAAFGGGFPDMTGDDYGAEPDAAGDLDEEAAAAADAAAAAAGSGEF